MEAKVKINEVFHNFIKSYMTQEEADNYWNFISRLGVDQGCYDNKMANGNYHYFSAFNGTCQCFMSSKRFHGFVMFDNDGKNEVKVAFDINNETHKYSICMFNTGKMNTFFDKYDDVMLLTNEDNLFKIPLVDGKPTMYYFLPKSVEKMAEFRKLSGKDVSDPYSLTQKLEYFHEARVQPDGYRTTADNEVDPYSFAGNLIRNVYVDMYNKAHEKTSEETIEK